jgi:hypothetical protein
MAIPTTLADVELILGAPHADVRALYDRAATRYDHFRALWLRLAGAAAERALIDDLRAVLRPGAQVRAAARARWPVRCCASSPARS